MLVMLLMPLVPLLLFQPALPNRYFGFKVSFRTSFRIVRYKASAMRGYGSKLNMIRLSAISNHLISTPLDERAPIVFVAHCLGGVYLKSVKTHFSHSCVKS